MDVFSWGTTHIAIGKGKDKEAVTNEGANLDESMIHHPTVYIPPQAFFSCLNFVVQNMKLSMGSWHTSLR